MVCRLMWLLLLWAPALLGQQYPFIQVPHSPRDIEHILQDRQGRLWIATHSDVLCFDGARFLSLHELGLPAELSNISEDLDGGILVSTESGVYRFFQGHLESLLRGVYVEETVGAAPGIIVAAVVTDYARAAAKLYRIRTVNGAWKAEQLGDWQSGLDLSRDNAGNILTTCPGGWCEVTAKQIANPDSQSSLRPIFHKSGLDLRRVVRDRFGCLWFRSIEAGAYQCPADPEPVRLPAAIAGRNIWASVYEDADGGMLFANVSSLAAGRPGSFHVTTPANGLPVEAISCAVRARDGSIWAGSIGGLYRFPFPFRMQYWKSRHGLVWSFARAGKRMLAGTSAGVSVLSDDGEWKILKGSKEFGSISSLLSDPEGKIYAAVSREAVIELLPDGSLAARTPPGRGGQASKLARTRDGKIWLAGEEIYRVIKAGPALSLEPSDPPGERPSGVHIELERSTGGLLACDSTGLITWENGTWRRITAPGELPERTCVSIGSQANGDEWLGFYDLLGFAFVHPGRRGEARVHRFQDGAEVGDIVSFLFGVDTRGWIWRGSADGIYVADSAQAQAGVWLHLNETDGLTEVDANRDSFFSDADGSVWWAANSSVVHFLPPPDLVYPSDQPPAFISAFSVNGEAPKLAETVQEFPNGKNLTAYIGSLQFERRNALRVRYRLLPEQAWHESKALDLPLGTPAWGTHTLEIQSRFSVGKLADSWSGTMRRRFDVLRPWWFSWQALLGFAGIGFGGGVSGVAWRKKRLARANISLPDIADWRLAALSPESQWVGTTLDGRFEVLDLVARGGFASVLKGRDLHGGRWCAIKIFRHEVIDEKWLTHSFQQEVAALEQIRHPSVVSIYGHGVTPQGVPYLVMEFIEGGTLRDLLNAGPLTRQRAGKLLLQAAGALDQIHARGIYHRDLKPENLMIRASSGDLVLIDFSIAIVKEPDQTIHGLSRAAGTIYYMAPEQAVGFATPASDVYSLAKILIEMLTGQRVTTLLPNAAMDLPDRVRELVRSLPIPISAQAIDLLGRALEFDPSRRPQSAMLFAAPIARDLSAD